MLVAMILDRAERARIAGALHGVTTVQFCDSASVISTAVVESGVHAVLTELCDHTGASTTSVIQAIRTKYPAIPVFMYLSLTANDVRELLLVATSIGVSGVVFRNIDDTGAALRLLFRTRCGLMPTAVILREIEPLVPRSLWPFVSLCMTQANRPITVIDVAAAIGTSRRTIVERLRRAGLPEPRRVIGWCRLLHAAWLLDDPRHTIEQVSVRAGFSSGSAFHNMLRRYTGHSAAAVRERGALVGVLDGFTAELRQSRRGTTAQVVGR